MAGFLTFLRFIPPPPLLPPPSSPPPFSNPFPWGAPTSASLLLNKIPNATHWEWILSRVPGRGVPGGVYGCGLRQTFLGHPGRNAQGSK